MSERKKMIIGWILLVFFIGLFLLGYVMGEDKTVLTKAAKICLECIGIG